TLLIPRNKTCSTLFRRQEPPSRVMSCPARASQAAAMPARTPSRTFYGLADWASENKASCFIKHGISPG
ncbi:hypothetical protein E4U43_006378, partial [Claviceps pusilla]